MAALAGGKAGGSKPFFRLLSENANQVAPKIRLRPPLFEVASVAIFEKEANESTECQSRYSAVGTW